LNFKDICFFKKNNYDFELKNKNNFLHLHALLKEKDTNQFEVSKFYVNIWQSLFRPFCGGLIFRSLNDFEYFLKIKNFFF
jgi:hypothetical protein